MIGFEDLVREYNDARAVVGEIGDRPQDSYRELGFDPEGLWRFCTRLAALSAENIAAEPQLRGEWEGLPEGAREVVAMTVAGAVAVQRGIIMGLRLGRDDRG